MDPAEVALFWLTPEFTGVNYRDLAQLESQIDDPDFVARVLRRALFRKTGGVELVDQGAEWIDGRPARRFAVSITRRKGPTIPQRFRIEGEAVIISVDPEVMLVAMVRLGPGATPAQGASLLARIAGSIEFAVWGHPAQRMLIAALRP